MQLHIHGSETIGDVKNEFNKQVPFLKIEFFHHGHTEGEGSPKSDMIGDEVMLSEVLSTDSKGVLSFNRDMKIFEVEKLLKDHFGLNVQIFRKSGRIWLETTKTDSWTLTQAEEEANEFEID